MPIQTKHSPNRTYYLRSYILLFFIFSLIGWLWEILLYLLENGKFVNRGFLHGPWLPIYGTGGILIIILFKKWTHHPIFTLFLIMFSCSILEYFTSYALELYKNLRWWDYTGYFMNINGRICLLGTLFFGFGGMYLVYILGPLLDDLISRYIPIKLQYLLCLALLIAFIIDISHSIRTPNTGNGISSPTKKMVFKNPPE